MTRSNNSKKQLFLFPFNINIHIYFKRIKCNSLIALIKATYYPYYTDICKIIISADDPLNYSLTERVFLFLNNYAKGFIKIIIMNNDAIFIRIIWKFFLWLWFIYLIAILNNFRYIYNTRNDYQDLVVITKSYIRTFITHMTRKYWNKIHMSGLKSKISCFISQLFAFILNICSNPLKIKIPRYICTDKDISGKSSPFFFTSVLV